MPTDIVAFYTHPGGTPDHRGRTLSGILALPDAALEAHHDYIQLLFPLPESSMFAYNAPILTPSITAAFRSTLALRLRLRESFARMLTFYGFRATEDAGMLAVVPLRPGATPVRSWWSRSGHNHLRITRIIRSLRILGCEGEAEAFWAALEGECGRAGEGGRRGPGETSRGFWRAAARRPVEVPPERALEEGWDEEDEEGVVGYARRRWRRDMGCDEPEDGEGVREGESEEAAEEVSEEIGQDQETEAEENEEEDAPTAPRVPETGRRKRTRPGVPESDDDDARTPPPPARSDNGDSDNDHNSDVSQGKRKRSGRGAIVETAN